MTVIIRSRWWHQHQTVSFHGIQHSVVKAIAQSSISIWWASKVASRWMENTIPSTSTVYSVKNRPYPINLDHLCLPKNFLHSCELLRFQVLQELTPWRLDRLWGDPWFFEVIAAKQQLPRITSLLSGHHSVVHCLISKLPVLQCG